MTKDCDNCHLGSIPEYTPSCLSHNCFDNPGHPNWQPMTNADKVRNMTDEELKEVLMKFSRTDGKLSEEEVVAWLGRTDDEQDSGS